MGKATFLKKYITYARNMARKESTARIDGRSIFIKRYSKDNYHIIMVHVTAKQRTLRDLFAIASRMAKEDLKSWNRVRHWERYAKQHRKLGAYRAAVSFYHRMLITKSEIRITKYELRITNCEIRNTNLRGGDFSRGITRYGLKGTKLTHSGFHKTKSRARSAYRNTRYSVTIPCYSNNNMTNIDRRDNRQLELCF